MASDEMSMTKFVQSPFHLSVNRFGKLFLGIPLEKIKTKDLEFAITFSKSEEDEWKRIKNVFVKEQKRRLKK